MNGVFRFKHSMYKITVFILLSHSEICVDFLSRQKNDWKVKESRHERNPEDEN